MICGGGISWLGCGSPVYFERIEHEWEHEKRAGIAIRCLDCGALLCPHCATEHFAKEKLWLARELEKLRKVAALAQQLDGVQDGLVTHTPVRLAIADWHGQVSRNNWERAGKPRQA
jgi:hypothetical protein